MEGPQADLRPWPATASPFLFGWDDHGCLQKATAESRCF
jgi:hypothetical protein